MPRLDDAMTQSLERQLGHMAGVMDRLLAQIEAQGKVIEDVRSNQSRLMVEDQMRDLRLAAVEQRVAAVEPVAASVTSWKARWAGALMVIGFIGTLAAGGTTLFWDRLGQTLGFK